MSRRFSTHLAIVVCSAGALLMGACTSSGAPSPTTAPESPSPAPTASAQPLPGESTSADPSSDSDTPAGNGESGTGGAEEGESEAGDVGGEEGGEESSATEREASGVDEGVGEGEESSRGQKPGEGEEAEAEQAAGTGGPSSAGHSGVAAAPQTTSGHSPDDQALSGEAPSGAPAGPTAIPGGPGPSTHGEIGRGLDSELQASLEAFDAAMQSEQATVATQRSAIPAGDGGDRDRHGEEDRDGGESGRSTDEPVGSETETAPGAEMSGDKAVGGSGAGADRASEECEDDIVARQLREAAEEEADPDLRERLWEEYREYKRGSCAEE